MGVCWEVVPQERLQHRPQPALRPVHAAVLHEVPRVPCDVLQRHPALQAGREDGAGAGAADLGLLPQHAAVAQGRRDANVVGEQAAAGAGERGRGKEKQEGEMT